MPLFEKGDEPFFVAKVESTCCLCKGIVGEGSPTFPTQFSPEKPTRYLWAHLECAKQEAGGVLPDAPVCKHWKFHGRCLYKEKCFFSHPQEVLEEYNRKQAEIEENGGRKRNRGPGKRNKVQNYSRAFVFRRFLLDTYGIEFLRSGSGVVDVAGGKGEIGFELKNLNGIEATNVDPRPMDLRKFVKKYEWDIYNRNPLWRKYQTTYDKNSKPSPPRHIRAFFDPPLTDWAADIARSTETISGISSVVANVAWYKEHLDKAKRIKWIRQGHEEFCELASNFTADEVSTDDPDLPGRKTATKPGAVKFKEPASPPPEYESIDDLQTALEVLSNASLVVGLHSDQATERIVDFALAAGKPFAVVPCCVYQKCFPDRKLPNGQLVNTYDEFITYICAKDPRIRTQALGFDGRNIAVYLPLPDDI
ncbi:hypothetical protein Pmar_PMAR016612 [Perkinsus marinus ATCC 50983]|uniref:C3H1-type domain-containing protein n=1 Tax=Perkinsus marinus (strain ATCC 50983 / TXsc) TaxID=423536 RepID=C5KTN4_PERM5|nr:hypothetical protein Pmar_PMAR016612 [Perkinsus marinus ATCC 50983]EER12213.1 hypothetical protein Pmar_PMAR016612 [Perkinsus marinus ATCC 50983]|eukprot:XP_002780418.1 hypothetical protein Pmar_PMAR016612 [Perkinsus marinus ATCC 50983]